MTTNPIINKARKIFVDSVKIKVCGGSGGPGLPKYGGIGGKGGDVYIRGSQFVPKLNSLFKKAPDGFFKAGDGQPSLKTRLIGQPGRDLIIQVPFGVTVEDHNRQYIADINTAKDEVIVALGGRGGDKFNDSHGFQGQKRLLRLDLKMISDAVFVGFPNAGKSSLLQAVSRATPKVADYPFTTLKPSLGMVKFPDYRSISMADLPGLVEGAHQNLGMGHEFLKHIVRSRVLVFLVDINGVDLGPAYPRRTALETLSILIKEIELYDDTILRKPAILAISKMDTIPDALQKFETLKEQVEKMKDNSENCGIVDPTVRSSTWVDFSRILPISSKSMLNIEELKTCVREVIDDRAELEKLQQDKFSTFEELLPSETNRLLGRGQNS